MISIKPARPWQRVASALGYSSFSPIASSVVPIAMHAERQRAGDAEGLGRRHEGLALEGALDEVDEVIGEMGQVTEGLMRDRLPLADRSSEQMSDVGLSVVDPFRRSHMNGAGSCCHAAILQRDDEAVKGIPPFLVATFPSGNRG
jgi:hypothetical protein